MDDTELGEFKVEINTAAPIGKKIQEWECRQHDINDRLNENPVLRDKVAAVRLTYTPAGYVKPISCESSSIYWNIFSETCLHGPLDAVAGTTGEALHRDNFSDEPVPGVLEGASHNWIADGMRWWAGSDAATVRGFRFGLDIKSRSAFYGRAGFFVFE